MALSKWTLPWDFLRLLSSFFYRNGKAVEDIAIHFFGRWLFIHGHSAVWNTENCLYSIWHFTVLSFKGLISFLGHRNRPPFDSIFTTDRLMGFLFQRQKAYSPPVLLVQKKEAYSMLPYYFTPNTWRPILVVMGTDHIQRLVAVAGFQ